MTFASGWFEYCTKYEVWYKNKTKRIFIYLLPISGCLTFVWTIHELDRSSLGILLFLLKCPTYATISGGFSSWRRIFINCLAISMYSHIYEWGDSADIARCRILYSSINFYKVTQKPIRMVNLKKQIANCKFQLNWIYFWNVFAFWYSQLKCKSFFWRLLKFFAINFCWHVVVCNIYLSNKILNDSKSV